ncbi:MAG: hypothetical protein AAGA90_02020 [Actinomycetota bacterium]
MTPSVALVVDATASPLDRALIDHAFRVWAMSRRFRVADTDHADHRLHYGGSSVDALPVAGPLGGARWADGLPFAHRAQSGAEPDHLAEIAHWVSARAEAEATTDSIGRVPFAGSTAASLDADPEIPWASRHLDAFDAAVLRRIPSLGDALTTDRGGLRILGSHDIDFIARSRSERIERVAKNLGVAAIRMRDPRLVASIASCVVGNLLARRPILGDIATVMALEAEHGVKSTWNVIVRNAHRRDAAYGLHEPAVCALLDHLTEAGHEIGLHGSYTSGDTPGGLAEEFDLLRATGQPAVGHRHHWLRHDGFGLWQALAKAGASYDSSAGWSETNGFRHGMAEPFVPFDLTTGDAARVVEIPLVMMDVALSDADRRGEDAVRSAHRILDEAARHGGAVSVLWHDTTVLGTQVRRGIGGLYAQLLARGDRWERSDRMAAQYERFGVAAGLPLG